MSENASGAEPGSRHRRKSSVDLARIRVRVLTALGTLVRWAGTCASAVLAVHVVLTVGNANPDNGITRFFARWAQPLALGFQDLFRPADPQLDVLVNYGLAALFWLLVTSIAMRIITLLLG